MTLEKASQDIIAAVHSLLPGSRPSMVGASLRGVDLQGQNLKQEDMTSADLTGANLSGCNLSGAVLRNADLPGADLTDVDLTGGDLHGADLCGTVLTGAEGLASVNFEYAFGDANTVWPTGFAPGDRVVILRSEAVPVDEPESLPRRLSARMREEARELFERMRAKSDR
ncbi:MAG: pentapeptide repeat-containing protein [Jatrophihabitans sp.]